MNIKYVTILNKIIKIHLFSQSLLEVRATIRRYGQENSLNTIK